MSYDFSGWATKNNIRCSDGRTIMRDAFKAQDGQTVPLVWNHRHNEPENVLGHAKLENRENGVYAYCTFNDTESGRNAKLLVEHGDVNALSIYANQLKQQGGNVLHGAIREVSLVLAGANPGAFIDAVMCHGEESDEEAIIYSGDVIELSHADGKEPKKNTDTNNENKEDSKMADEKKNTPADGEETVEDVFNTLTDKQKTVVYALIGQALEENQGAGNNNEDEEDKSMKHNIFENVPNDSYLSHADQENIIALAKSNSIGSLQDAIQIYANENNDLAHGFDAGDLDALFPDYKDVRPGAPELITRDMGWVSRVMAMVHKSPISRIRTRQTDARKVGVRGKGYKTGSKKTEMGNVKLLKRTTDPQTIYVKDALNRDDIIDIVDFDVPQYQYGIMKMTLEEEVATALMIGDGRDEGDDDKISEEHIRPIWLDDDLYTIHTDIDIAAAKAELQGTDTGANFGDNYIYAESIIAAALYARENYKGTGTPDFFCTPHLLNVMLLARDLNGRRIYESKSDLAKALNVNDIFTAEQFEGKIRTDKNSKKHKLLGIMVNLADYQLGSTKGGEITKFNQFDIDFNQEKYLIETRLSGANTRVYSAIALEEPVATDGSST